MLLNTFTGNMNIKESLLGALAAGRLSHGLLLCGEKGMGVNHFAFLLACDIIGTSDLDSIKQGKNPLVQVVHGEGASGLIKVDKIRQINENVNFSSISGEKRVVIIQNCENFNSNSANALLKNLEEPKDDITYILTTNQPQSIMPTIRSRCSIYTLSCPKKNEVKQFFIDEDVDMDTIERFISIYGENIGKIKNVIFNDKRYAILQNAVSTYKYIKQNNAYEVSKLCYIYNKNKEDFKLFLDDLIDICHRNLSIQTVYIINTIQKYKQIIENNVNLNLVIENFAIEITK